ncbi:MAG: hypothetical protein ABW128_12300 [Rhizorhabdus sp.]
MRFLLLSTAALGMALGATAASAQDLATTSSSWTGPYVGGQLGYAWQPRDGDEQISFDRNRDGTFGDAFPNFSPGFCGGAPTSRSPATGCSKDNDGTTWKVHAGFDYQFGESSGPVIGAVIEYGRSYIHDSVTAFSTTPASYTFKAKLKENGSIRGRAGYGLGTGTLIYGTGGFAMGKIENSFSTTNGVNTFTPNDNSKNAKGYNWGGGIEQKVGPFSVGAMYLRTVLKNND